MSTMVRYMIIALAAAASFALQGPPVISRPTKTSLQAGVMNRGLEQRREGATPQEGGMTLYLKAAADGTSVGDCPFAHAVRMVLEEKGLEYDLRPSTQETKPSWLVEHYDGKMPALRHRKECYVESEVICQYLDFFFPNPSMTCKNKKIKGAAEAAVDGFFPRVAKYLKHTPDGDDDDGILKASLESGLQTLEDHLLSQEGQFLCGDQFTVMDCALAPKLYHMKTGLKAFKAGAVHVEAQFPKVSKYMDTVMARQSFVTTMYPEDVIVYGWGNARQ